MQPGQQKIGFRSWQKGEGVEWVYLSREAGIAVVVSLPELDGPHVGADEDGGAQQKVQRGLEHARHRRLAAK